MARYAFTFTPDSIVVDDPTKAKDNTVQFNKFSEIDLDYFLTKQREVKIFDKKHKFVYEIKRKVWRKG